MVRHPRRPCSTSPSRKRSTARLSSGWSTSVMSNTQCVRKEDEQQPKVDEWDRMIDVNLRGVLYGIAAALPHMKEQKSGHIINLSSVAGHKLFGGSAVYSATKFGVRALSEGLRMEVKPYNIRTTIISPGAVKTELLDHISEADVQQANRDYVGQVGVPADSFARVVAFAISQPQ